MSERTAPQLSNAIFLSYTGMETDLLFNRGIDLPGFASYPLLETDGGRETLLDYYTQLIDVGRRAGVGVILDSCTWIASRDRGAEIGYGPDALRRLNGKAIELLTQARERAGDVPIVVSAQMGPRGDAYRPADRMGAEEAEAYHAEQAAVLADSEADIISAFTLCYVEEAIGILRACRRYEKPVAIAFTVETDGKLPTGMNIGEALDAVDGATDEAAAYFLINCAHPDHFQGALEKAPSLHRLNGVVVNASRCSHAELDEATELDDGDPEELGRQLGELRTRFPHMNVFGGCCGTDMRHMQSIASKVVAAAA